jgi:hypothetical protein
MCCYVENRKFLQRAKTSSDEIMAKFHRILEEDYGIRATYHLIGSAEKNLLIDNSGEPVDFDYDIKIVRCADFNDCPWLRECSKRALDKSLTIYSLFSGGYSSPRNCEDSTLCLTVESLPVKRHTPNIYSPRASRIISLRQQPEPRFSMDVCITMEDRSGRNYRLIHRSRRAGMDEYYWNPARSFKEIERKESVIKKSNKWELVREQYLRLKRHYVSDENHPSFICYIEAVNNVYHEITSKMHKNSKKRKERCLKQ